MRKVFQVLMENQANQVPRVNKVLPVNPAMSASLDNRVRVERKVNLAMLERQVSVDVMDHPENVANLDLLVTRVRKDLVALKVILVSVV